VYVRASLLMETGGRKGDDEEEWRRRRKRRKHKRRRCKPNLYCVLFVSLHAEGYMLQTRILTKKTRSYWRRTTLDASAARS
jgi:hypothetical protein